MHKALIFFVLMACVAVGSYFGGYAFQFSESPCSVFYEKSKGLRFIELHNDDGYSLLLRESILDTNEKSWADIYKKIDQAFEVNHEMLKKNWGLDGQLLKAAFITGVVAHMWPLGYEEDESGRYEGGSVRRYCKKNKGGKICGLDGYLNSPVAECNDYATMLYMMFHYAGITVSHTGTADHIYVEAVIDSQAYVFDAMYAFFTPLSGNEFLNQKENKINYYLLPYAGSDAQSKYYRKRRGFGRYYYLLTRGRIDIREPKDYSHWDHFAKWEELNGVYRSGIKKK